MRFTAVTLFLIFSLFATAAQAQTYKNVFLKITNVTSNIYFAPMLLASHGLPNAMFEPGTAASAGIEAMAEIGDLTQMDTDLTAAGAFVTAAAGSVNFELAPGESVFAVLVVGPGLDFISMAGMMVQTNDGFVGLNSFQVPQDSTGQITLQLNGYDAGTELNNELLGCPTDPPFTGDPIDNPNVPLDPSGNGGQCGTGAQGGGESPLIHVHPGTHGDTDPMGGVSDLDSRVHRWLNPVAEMTVFY